MSFLTLSPSQLATPKRGSTYAVLKSLVNTDSAAPVTQNALPGQQESSGQVVINFPCMPDTIDLARKANYTNVLQTPVTPDGLHLYSHTDPLVIPISFTLQGFDRDYCQDAGPYMLLSIAAKLHALAMPIHRGGRLDRAATSSAAQATVAGGRSAEGFFSGQATAGAPLASNFAYPPACSLNIILAQLGSSGGTTNQSNNGAQSLGINCVGFLTDVRAVLKGPWLQGTLGSDGVRNMPSSADYSFTFVHQPGHTNVIGEFGFGTSVLTTSAKDIYDRLYNTIGLSRLANNTQIQYSGIDAFEVSSSTGRTGIPG